MNEPIEGKFSQFNEASYQMGRLNNEQSLINHYNLNLLAYDLERQNHNYILKFNLLTNLFIEASSKLTNSEKAKGKKLRKYISLLMDLKPAHKICLEQPNNKKITKFSYLNWCRIREALFEYELLVRHLLEKHKLTSPVGDEQELF